MEGAKRSNEWKHRSVVVFSKCAVCFFFFFVSSLRCSQCDGLNVHGIDNSKQTESNVLKMKVTGMPTLKAPKKHHLIPQHIVIVFPRMSDRKWFHICSFSNNFIHIYLASNSKFTPKFFFCGVMFSPYLISQSQRIAGAPTKSLESLTLNEFNALFFEWD